MGFKLTPATRLHAFVSNMIGTGKAWHSADQRRSPRHQAALSAQVVSGSGTYPAMIRNISTGGLTLSFDRMPILFRGAQLLVEAQGFPSFSGSVRWVLGDECGLAFNVALAEDMLEDSSALFDAGKRMRPARARVKLSAIARAPGFERKVMIDNISSGGAQISSGLAIPVAVGRGLMLEIQDIVLIGAYVRWSKQGRCGLMFNKLLPLSAAEEIADRCGVHPSWLQEVEMSHSALVKQTDEVEKLRANR